MNQFVEKNLSAPRGPLCCVSLINASPWNMNIQPPFCHISISKGVELGCASVPDVVWSSSMSMKERGALAPVCDMPAISGISGVLPVVWPKQSELITALATHIKNNFFTH